MRACHKFPLELIWENFPFDPVDDKLDEIPKQKRLPGRCSYLAEKMSETAGFWLSCNKIRLASPFEPKPLACSTLRRSAVCFAAFRVGS